MCRSILRLREGAEIHEREASQANHEVFEAAIEAIAAATESLMLSLQIRV